jgi:hypothetical protein
MNALAALLLAATPCTLDVEWRNVGDVALIADCPPAYFATRQAVQTALRQAGQREDLRIRFGRVADHPWLSALLARQASSSRRWPEARDAPEGYVTRALLGMPEFTALFHAQWRIASVVVKDVRMKPAAQLDLPRGHPLPGDFLLPYDADLIVTLVR